MKKLLLLGALPVLAGWPLAAVAQSGAAFEAPLGVRAGRMVVEAHAADGTQLQLLVSTGSAVTVLSESGAAKIGDGPVTLGGAPVNLQDRQIISDARLTVDGTVMDGLVSNNTLNEFDVLFDVPGGRLVLKPFGRSVEWPGMELSDPIRLRVYHGVVLALDLELDGHVYPAMLELGAPSLLVNQAVLDETGLTDGAAETLKLGGTSFPDVPVELSDHPIIQRFSPNGDAFVIVGTPPALACPVAISWVHREMRTCVR